MFEEKYFELINNLILLLNNDEDKLMYKQVSDYLIELGYIPKKQKVQGYVLSFIHHKSNKIIARIGIRGSIPQNPFISMRFFACNSYSQKFHDAIKFEIVSRNGQYCTPKLKTDLLSERNRCGHCNSCTGGGLGYYYIYPDGKEVVRCGAYPIIIPNLNSNDINEVKRLLLEQHNYFLTIA